MKPAFAALMARARPAPTPVPPYAQPGATAYNGATPEYFATDSFAPGGTIMGVLMSLWFKVADAHDISFFGEYRSSGDGFCGPFVYDSGGPSFTHGLGFGIDGDFDVEMITPYSVADDAWHHALFAGRWGVSPTAAIYLDDALLTIESYVDIGRTDPYQIGSHFSVGAVKSSIAAPTYLGGITGCMAEVFLAGEYLDLSVEANRRKFITADLKPVDLGDTGSLPLGTQPIYYSKFGNGTNLGSGGNLTEFGSTGQCGSHP